jgi:nucleotide-binding universal stress UspA family protein
MSDDINMKILVGSSGRHDDSSDPITAAASFPWPAGSEIHVLTVAATIQPPVTSMVPGEVPPMVDVAAVQKRADAVAETAATAAAAQLQSRGFRTEGVTVEGDPASAIADYAATWGADLIVVGMHDRSLVERLLLGSVPESVVKHAPCSVLVVKHRAAPL